MQQGFFTQKETESTTRPNGKTLSCSACGAFKTCLNPKLKPYGNYRKHIMIIGESPGEVEDRRGLPWQGKAGRLLETTLAKLGVNLFEDCICLYAVRCRLIDTEGGDRMPTADEASHCSRFIFPEIIKYAPKVIIVLGQTALYSLLKNRWQRDLGGIQKWRGYTIPDQDMFAWVCPTFDPHDINKDNRDAETIWLSDLQQAVSMCDRPFPKYRKPKITILTDLTPLQDITADLVAFDYETTGIKPQAKEQHIVCASVAVSETEVFAFMMPKKRADRRPFIKLLANNLIGKMAHNMKYEEMWSVVQLQQPVQNWAWDSMIASHVLDNRPGVTSLKFQTYVNLGVVDYESEVSPYLQSGDKDGNAVNTVDELVKTKEGQMSLLQYCALDSINEYRLARLQQKQINYTFLPF